MGLFVILLTIFVFIYFSSVHFRRFKNQIRYEHLGYALMTKKYQDDFGTYYAFFEQGENEWRIEISVNQYVQLREMTRGKLVVESNRLVSFET